MKKYIIILSFLFYSISIINAQQWKALSSGTEGGLNVVYALTQYDSNLIAGGWFDSVGGVFTPNLAQWNGVKWDTIGSPPILTDIQAECVYDNNLIIAGEYGPDIEMSQWDGTTWNGINTQEYQSIGVMELFDFAIWNGNLYACGVVGRNFNSASNIAIWNGNLYACGVVGRNFNSASNIAIWNGNNWDTLPSGVIKKNGGPSIHAMIVYDGNLYMGGEFDTAGNVPAKNITMWNGTNWSAVGDGFNGVVSSFCIYNGKLYAAGGFDSSGTQKISCISSWDGTKWNPLGLGIEYGGVGVALVQYSSLLCVAGSFDSAGGQRANNIAFWDGTNWSTLGSGVTGTGSFPTAIFALSIYKGALIAAGSFDTAGGIPANNIAEWLSPLGINEIVNMSTTVDVYPNPNNGQFTIQAKSEELIGNGEVEIYNVLGEKIYSAMLKQVQHDHEINLSSQPQGVYLYRVLTQNGELIGEGKVVIEK